MMNNGPDKVEVFLMMARQLSRLSHCVSRHVGCICTDKHNRIIAEGYNGSPSKVKHVCEEEGKCYRRGSPGVNLENCLAIHAEINALMYCNDIKKVRDMYIWGASPCFECAKAICNTSIRRIFVNQLYTPESVLKVTSLFKQKSIEMYLIDFLDSQELVKRDEIRMSNIRTVSNFGMEELSVICSVKVTK
jgi:dCMP deaminase